MVRSNAKLHLCSHAGDKTHCLHGNCNTLDGCSSFESLDSLYPQVSAKHRWRLHCCLCYQGIIYDVISLCLSLYNHTTETSNCLCKFCSPWPLIWTGQKIFYFISLINYSGYVLESMVQWNMNQKELFPFLQYFWDLVGYQMSFQQSWFTFKEES